MTKPKIFAHISGFCFFLGFMLSKLQYLPFTALASTFRFVSLAFYLGAYVNWALSNLFLPHHEKKHEKWYGFAKINIQYVISSTIGFVATGLSVAAIFVPILFIPAAWLFVVANAIWAVAEYHKLKNPPHDDAKFAYTRQQAFFRYSITTASISLVTAAAATFMLIFPIATIPITIFSLLICVGLGFYTFENWLSANFGTHKLTPPPDPEEIGTELQEISLSNNLVNDVTNAQSLGQKPTHTQGIPWIHQWAHSDSSDDEDENQEQIPLLSTEEPPPPTSSLNLSTSF